MEADKIRNKPLYKYMARTWRAMSATPFLVHKIPVTVYDSVFKIVGYYTGAIIKP